MRGPDKWPLPKGERPHWDSLVAIAWYTAPSTFKANED